jgi:hypothetical protein
VLNIGIDVDDNSVNQCEMSTNFSIPSLFAILMVELLTQLNRLTTSYTDSLSVFIFPVGIYKCTLYPIVSLITNCLLLIS